MTGAISGLPAIAAGFATAGIPGLPAIAAGLAIGSTSSSGTHCPSVASQRIPGIDAIGFMLLGGIFITLYSVCVSWTLRAYASWRRRRRRTVVRGIPSPID